MTPRAEDAYFNSDGGSYRPPVMGFNHMVASGHYLATNAGSRVFEQGGNAIDAGVAAGLAINVVQPDSTSFGGVAPIIIYSARRGEVLTISGLGRWPHRASIGHFAREHDGELPVGVEQCVVPAAADAWITALKEHGTMTFEQVAAPARQLAMDGFPVHSTLARASADLRSVFARWPSTAAVFSRDGRPLAVGERLVQPALASTFDRLIGVERKAAARGREAALQVTRDHFYQGAIAEEIVSFVQESGGLLTMEDMAEFEVGHETPESGAFGNYEVFSCGPWSQGPVVPMTAQLLSARELSSLGHNTADYIHLVTEALKLSFADRDAFFGDPEFVDVPITGLMSRAYAEERRRQIDPERASAGMPRPGDPWRHEGRSAPVGHPSEPVPVKRAAPQPDTSYACAVDDEGNMFSATPSDTLTMTPIIPSLGFTPSGRGIQTWLDPHHPSSLAPWKRPRLTPNPGLVFRDGYPWMAFGTPGGDAQPQAMLQTLLNIVAFGMNVQRAAEVPRFLTWSFPNSFWPHEYRAGALQLESRIPDDVGRDLTGRGHKVTTIADFAPTMGCMNVITRDIDTGLLSGAADPRREAYAVGR